MKSLFFLVVVLSALFFSSSDAQCMKSGLRGRYYSGFKPGYGEVLLETYEAVNFKWPSGGPNTLTSLYSVIWDGVLSVPVSGNYYFRVRSDDGFALSIGGSTVTSHWLVRLAANTTSVAPIYLEAGNYYEIELEYFQYTGAAEVALFWKEENGADFEVVPLEHLNVITCGVDISEPVIISDNEESTEFQVNLKSAPNCTLIVTLTSPYPLSVCQLVFNNTDYADPQIVTLYNDPNLEFPAGTTCIPLVATTTCDNLVYDQLETTICIEKVTKIGSKAITWGDPHFTTFDGVKHDFFDIGDFYFVRQTNSEFVIITRQNVCATVSCNYAVAVRYRNAVFYVYMDTFGVPTTFSSGDLIGSGLSITSGFNSFTVKTASNIITDIKVGLWVEKNIYYLSVETTMPTTYKTLIYGLGGYYDGNPLNDFTTKDGIVTSDVPVFQESWRVEPEENLFLDPNAVIPRLFGAPAPSDVLPTKADCANTTKSDVTDYFQNDKNETFPLDPDPFPNDFVPTTNVTNTTEANATCTELFINSDLAVWCFQCSPDLSYYEACVLDYAVMQSQSFLLDALKSYKAYCEYECKKKGIDPLPDTNCTDFCNMNGECTADGCQCDPGYSGTACEIPDLPPLPTIVDPVAGADCSGFVKVQGTNLINVVCNFGDVSVEAVELSQWKILCPIPAQSFSVGVVPLSITRDGVGSGTLFNFTYYEACCTNPCLNGASCVDNPETASVTCECAPGFEGDNCEIDIPDCTPTTCENGGTCTSIAGAYNCGCSPDFEGRTCSQKKVCSTLNVKSYCYDKSTDSTSICYNLVMDPHASCSPQSFQVETACNSPSGVTPSATYDAGLSSYVWDAATVQANQEFCLEYNTYIPAVMATATVVYDQAKVYSIETPYCPV